MTQETKQALAIQGLAKVGAERFELSTFWSQTRRASQTAPRPDGRSKRGAATPYPTRHVKKNNRVLPPG